MKAKRDFSLRKPTPRRSEVVRKASAYFFRNDGGARGRSGRASPAPTGRSSKSKDCLIVRIGKSAEWQSAGWSLRVEDEEDAEDDHQKGQRRAKATFQRVGSSDNPLTRPMPNPVTEKPRCWPEYEPSHSCGRDRACRCGARETGAAQNQSRRAPGTAIRPRPISERRGRAGLR